MYQIVSLPIADRIASQRRDFVRIAGSEEREKAEDLRSEKSKFLDLVPNTGEHKHGDSDCTEVLLIRQRTIASKENVEARFRSNTK